MKHPITITGYTGSLEDLGREIGQMRYDAQLAVLHAFKLELYEQMQTDAEVGRKQLAGHLAGAFNKLAWACRSLQDALSVSRPHMQQELREHPEITSGQIAA